MAKQFDLSILVKVVNQATAPLKKIFKDIQKVTKVVAKMGKQFQKVGRQISNTGKKMSAIGKDLTLRLTAPLAAAGLMSLKSAADIETMTIAFKSMLGSAEKAGEVVKDILDFTAKTPFQMKGVGQAAKQLLAFGVAQKDLIPRLKVLGDIAAGTNAPLSDIAQIFGKIKAKNKAMTEEILQLSDRGIPIIKMLSEEYGITGEQVLKAAEKSKISFDIIFKAMTKMSNKGGIFANQMEKQSGTLAGLFSTLKDNVVLAFGAIGDQMVETLNLKENMSKFIKTIQEMTKAFVDFAKANPKIMKLVFTLGLLLATLGPIVVIVGSFLGGIGFLITGLGSLAVILGTTAGAIAIFAGAFIAAAAGIVAIITLVTLLVKDFWVLKKLVLDLWDKAGLLAFLTPLTAMVKTIELLVKGYQKFKNITSTGKTEGQKTFDRQIQGRMNLNKMRRENFQARNSETKVLIEVKGKDGAEGQVKSVKGTAPVSVSTEALVGAF